MDFRTATTRRDQLEAEYNAAARALKSLSGGGLMNLTPDSVKETPEWKAAKQRCDKAAKALQAFNAGYTRQFRAEIAQARRNRGR